MKKVRLLLSILCSAVLCSSIVAQHRQEMWPRLKDTIEQKKAEKERLNALLTTRQYDSVISYCQAARTRDYYDYDDIELALATTYWYKGDKTTAYQYVQNAADYSLKLNGGGGSPFHMLYDYDFGTALASDTFLEQMIVGKVSDYYLAMTYYPDRSSGLRLMLLDYNEQKLTNKYWYDLDHATTEVERKTLKAQYDQEKETVDNRLVDLLKENKKIFTRHEIGPADEKQFRLIGNFHKQEQLATCIPLLYQAMVAKEIDPDAYVSALVSLERLKDNNKDQHILQDSLCRIYKCKRSIIDSMGRMISYVTGDTTYLPKNATFLQDAKGVFINGVIKANTSGLDSTKKK